MTKNQRSFDSPVMMSSEMPSAKYSVNADRPRNVLHLLLAHVLKAEAELVAHLIVNVARNANSARLGERLQPRRHVHAVAINIVVVADDIADIDSNAELDAAFGRYLGIALDHAALDVNGATHGVDDADKFHQHAVAGCLDDPAPMLGDFGIDQVPCDALSVVEGLPLRQCPSTGCNRRCRPPESRQASGRREPRPQGFPFGLIRLFRDK